MSRYATPLMIWNSYVWVSSLCYYAPFLFSLFFFFFPFDPIVAVPAFILVLLAVFTLATSTPGMSITTPIDTHILRPGRSNKHPKKI